MVWRRKNEELNPKNLVGTVKYGGRDVLVWGCMSASELVTPPPDAVDDEPEPSAPPLEFMDKVRGYESASFEAGESISSGGAISPVENSLLSFSNMVQIRFLIVAVFPVLFLLEFSSLERSVIWEIFLDSVSCAMSLTKKLAGSSTRGDFVVCNNSFQAYTLAVSNVLQACRFAERDRCNCYLRRLYSRSLSNSSADTGPLSKQQVYIAEGASENKTGDKRIHQKPGLKGQSDKPAWYQRLLRPHAHRKFETNA
ncbi:hypothetical protein AVEN_164245-1 [Araneus ventricosus]|uniref:Uncharacterized protein n=1 Tax=Araneus ventricosus TaxID=182803 RepID=A0A4Y2WIR4_ARAVE|nr:hypothetical protein AVEN_164245-1 [Araneus ventricosus]